MSDTIVVVALPPRKPRTPIKRKSVKVVLKRKPRASTGNLKPKAKKWKFKKTELKKLDTHFSEKIRRRDGHCRFPGCSVDDFKSLQNSHYIGRATWATRFDEENCIALCWFHHYKSKDLGWEYQKQRLEKQGWDGQYTIWMNVWLGERFQLLLDRAESGIKRKDAILAYQALIDSKQPGDNAPTMP